MAHLLEFPVPDPTGLTPLADESRFAAILERMVCERAPRLFAVVQEYSERVDAAIAAWGMAFAGHAEVVSVTGGVRMSLNAPEGALIAFGVGDHVRARLVWLDAVTPPGGSRSREWSDGVRARSRVQNRAKRRIGPACEG